MDISRIDSNFIISDRADKEDLVWMDAAEDPFTVYGAVSVNPYLRMPDEIAKNVSEGVYRMSQTTAGIRLRFRTDSPYLAIRAEWRELMGTASRGTRLATSGFDLYRVSVFGDRQTFLHSFQPPGNPVNGYESETELDGEMTDYVLNFPLFNNVDRLYIGVKAGSHFEKHRQYMNDRPVIYYGSSVTQGGCASRPGNCYQNFLSRALNMDYVNLGFSGSGRGEDEIISYLADLNMSVFVSDYDYNAPTAEHLAKTHEKLYLAIRAKHPSVPYIMLSHPNFANTQDDCARRSIIMQTYLNALKSGDKRVYFVDGASIFAGDERDACTVDGIHPNDIGFYRYFQTLLPIFEEIFSK